jgi:hypothetical protein
MSRTAVIGSAEYEAESAWGENTTTYGTRLAILDSVDLSGFGQESIAPGRVTQYRGEHTMKIRGVKTGSFSIRLWLAGHGSTTAGATSATALGTLLANAVGTIPSPPSGTTLTGSTDADTWATTASATFTAGMVCFLGALGDGDGEGQAYPITSHITTAMEVALAAAGAPANAAVLYSAENIHPDPDGAATLTSTRWRLMTANQQIEAHGCFPTAISYQTALGQPPSVTITYQASWWTFASATQPTATAVNEFNPAPISAGSFVLQTHGTTTRSTRSIRSISINHNLDIVPLMGPGGIDANQVIVGAVRGGGEVMTLDITEDAQTASATPTVPGYWDSDSQYYHAMFTFNGAATGKRVALYVRKCYFSGPNPQQINEGGINRWRYQLTACVDTAGSTDITRAPYVWALG